MSLSRRCQLFVLGTEDLHKCSLFVGGAGASILLSWISRVDRLLLVCCHTRSRRYGQTSAAPAAKRLVCREAYLAGLTKVLSLSFVLIFANSLFRIMAPE